MRKKIVIIGAGPTGLGAAYRLYELGYRDFVLYEKNSYAGGFVRVSLIKKDLFGI